MLEKILEDHELWFKSKGDQGSRAILRGINFEHSVLCNAVLVEADLMGSRFSFADLRGADLRGANLQDTIFENARLENTNFEEADLMMSDFRGAHVRGAKFAGAYLQGADLRNLNGFVLEQIKDSYQDDMTLL